MKKTKVASMHDLITDDKRLSKQPAVILDEIKETFSIKEDKLNLSDDSIILNQRNRDIIGRPLLIDDGTTEYKETKLLIMKHEPIVSADVTSSDLRPQGRVNIVPNSSEQLTVLKTIPVKITPKFSKKRTGRESEVST